MKRTSTLVIALWAMLATTTATAQKGTEQELVKKASTLFNSGEYLKAYPLYSQLVSLYPNHTEYNYKFGACAIFSDPDKTKAVKFLTIATSKSDQEPMAWYYLGKAYHLNYQFKDAISAYEQFLRKADSKVASKTDAQRNIETCIYGSNLLANIKDISVINKTESDKQNFFRAIDLTGIGGKILTVPEELKTKLDQKSTEPGVIHYPGNSTTIYFSSFGKDGSTGKDIYKANMLPDGKFSAPEKLQGDVNTKYDEDYCFMHSDGKTLYFASKGHNSMGGYDIFKSVLDPATNKFGPAINLDFAINTPDDDIFYISDSLNQRAYFASARSSDQDHINVYNVLVESAPLQIVYLKGYYTNTINPDQKKATIQVKSELSGKVEMEGSTAMSSGNYMLYVQKPGEYTFKVKTENSPVVHEVKVNVPAFEKPVALKQEMKLISENGKDKLVVVNHFELPLNEDISALAAEMLRKKSGLEVNTNPEMLSQIGNKSAGTENITSLEHTMENAPLAAGYGDGVTVQAVITGMVEEKKVIDKFIAESELKYNNGYAYALKKQREADQLLAKAEQLHQSTSNYSTEEDVKKLRESMDLVKRAELLKRESNAAIVAAEAVKQYKSSETERSHQLTDRIQMLKQAHATGNFDVAVTEMRTERERVQKLKSGEALTPYDELANKAKARESEVQKAEERLSSLRDEEKSLKEKLKIAESKMSTAKKKSEIQAAETEFATAKSELDNISRSIVAQTEKIRTIGIEAKDAFANASLFKQLSENTEMNLNKSEQAILNEQEKTTLTMKLKEMDSRVAALDITDPQTLALITDGMAEGDAMRTATGSTSETSSGTLSSTSTTTTTSQDNNAASTTENGATATAANDATPLPNIPGVGETANSGKSAVRDVQTLRTGVDASVAKAGSNTEAQKMFLTSGLTQTNEAIAQLDAKKKKSGLNAQEEKNLNDLSAYRDQLISKVMALNTATVTMSNDALRSTYNSVNPGYTVKLQEINNSSSSEIAKMEAVMDHKLTTIEMLRQARLENSAMAMASSDPDAMATFASKDARYEAALNSLQNETGDVNQYRAAYETQNKAIIESNDVFTSKLNEQIDATEAYLITLEKLESEKRSKLYTTTNSNEIVSLNAQINEIKEEKLATNIKLQNYMKDLSLTAATSDAKASSTAVAVNAPKNAATNLEDAIEQSENNEAGRTAEVSPEEAKKKVEKDAETFGKIFKTRVESESIFAYESGNFEEIVAQHQSAENQLQNRDKIQTLNDQIFLIEAEMENEKSDAKLRKLDYKAEQIYLKRALIEIGNAPVIARMTEAEFKEELSGAKSSVATNKTKIDSRFMIKDEVNQLFASAEANMAEAAELRQTAPSIQDDIERADYYRQAFAKEALAIEQVKQVKAISDNIDAMLEYDEQELAQLRTGKAPNLKLAENLTAEVNNKTTATSNDVISAAGDASAQQVADNQTSSETALISSAADVQSNEDTEQSAVKTSSISVTPISGISANDTTSDAASTSTTNSANNGETEVVQQREFVDISSPTVTDNKSVVADAANFAAQEAARNKANAQAAMAAANMSNDAMNAGQTKSTKVDVSTETNSIAANTVNTTAETMGSATLSNSNSKAIAANSASSSSSTARAPSANAADYDAEDYYFSAPEYVTKDIFKRTTRAVYSSSKPIPVDMPMPKGVYYKVQIGAFRNDIPQNLYDEFAPVCGENLNNGITRYTAGFFVEFKSADDVKREIRSIGYSDAFVVAYRDGKRIPLYEAMGKTNQQDFQAAVEKEYIYGDGGEAPVRKSSTTSTTSTTTADVTSGQPVKAGTSTTSGDVKAGNNTTSNAVASADMTTGVKTNYYKATGDAAKAVEVETIKGLFYTVQVGVYSKPVPAKSLYNIDPLNTELTETSKIRYTSGRFTSLAGAVDKRFEARSKGISDAFVTAYYNGKRIGLSEADRLLKEMGPGILMAQ